MHRKCTGEFWTINEHAAKVYGINHIESEKGAGVTRMPNAISEGGNSGYQAIGLGLLFGAGRIVLLGYDMQLTNGRKHWHADHARNNPTAQSLKNWRTNYAALAAQTPAPIINCSRATALTCFDRMDLDAGLAWLT